MTEKNENPKPFNFPIPGKMSTKTCTGVQPGIPGHRGTGNLHRMQLQAGPSRNGGRVLDLEPRRRRPLAHRCLLARRKNPCPAWETG